VKKMLLLLLIISIIGTFSLLSCKAEEAVEEQVEEAAEEEVTVETEISGSIRFLGWEGYEFPEAYKELTEKYGVTIDPTYLTSNDEVFSKLYAGAEYDLTTPHPAYWKQLIENDLIQPIDIDKIPNYENIFSPVLKVLEPFNYDGKVWGVPILYAYNEFIYNADNADSIESWWEILEPEWKDRYVIMDDPMAFLIMAERMSGKTKDLNLVTPEELAEYKDILIDVKNNARTMVYSLGEAKNIIISGEADAWVQGFFVAPMARAEGYNVWSCIPKEGTVLVVDCYVIPKNAPNPDGAYAILNEVLKIPAQMSVVDDLSGGAITNDAIESLTEDQRSRYDYDNLEELFAENEMNGPFPTEAGEYITFGDMVTMWEEVKMAE